MGFLSTDAYKATRKLDQAKIDLEHLEKQENELDEVISRLEIRLGGTNNELQELTKKREACAAELATLRMKKIRYDNFLAMVNHI